MKTAFMISVMVPLALFGAFADKDWVKRTFAPTNTAVVADAAAVTNAQQDATIGQYGIAISNLQTEKQDKLPYDTNSIPDSAIASASVWNAKQNSISDLDTIRSGATAGSTAVQPSAISDMASKTWVGQQGFAKSSEISYPVTDVKVDGTSIVSGGVADVPLSGKQDVLPYPTNAVPWSVVSGGPTKTSDLTNDSGFLTQHQDISGKANISYVDDATNNVLTAAMAYADAASPNITAGTGITVENGTVGINQSSVSLTNILVRGNGVEITDGAVQNFSTESYVVLDKVFSPGSSAWTIETAFKVPYSMSNSKHAIIGSERYNYDPVMIAIQPGKVTVELASGTSSSVRDDEFNYSFTEGIVYRLKLSFSGSSYSVGIKSPSDADYVNKWTYDSTTPVFGGDKLAFGIQCVGSEYSRSSPFSGGTIYLSDTNITIGDDVFFTGEGSSSGIAKATSFLYGLVKPDETSITVNDGILSVKSSVTNDLATKDWVDLNYLEGDYGVYVNATYLKKTEAPTKVSDLRIDSVTTNVIREVTGTFWDPGLTVTWKMFCTNGNFYVSAITNVNVTGVQP